MNVADKFDYLVVESVEVDGLAVEKMLADSPPPDLVDGYLELEFDSVEPTKHLMRFRNRYKIYRRILVADVRFGKLSVFYFAPP